MKAKILNIIINLSLIPIFMGIWIPEYRGRLIITGVMVIILCVLEPDKKKKKAQGNQNETKT